MISAKYPGIFTSILAFVLIGLNSGVSADQAVRIAALRPLRGPVADPRAEIRDGMLLAVEEGLPYPGRNIEPPTSVVIVRNGKKELVRR